jgi:arylformamidase
MFARLSYDTEPNAPGWPGNPTMEHRYHTHMSRGDPATHSLVTIFTHFGSHLDAPSHWNPVGPDVCDLGLEYYIYEKPLIIDIPKTELELIEPSDLLPFAAEIAERDLILIRTGWSSVRIENPRRYAERGPAIGSEAARYLVGNFPELRAIGIDCISIGCPSRMQEAIASHEILAGKYEDGGGLVNIEDIHLEVEASRLWRVFALPLFMKGLEGSPCTVVAQLREDEPAGVMGTTRVVPSA